MDAFAVCQIRHAIEGAVNDAVSVDQNQFFLHRFSHIVTPCCVLCAVRGRDHQNALSPGSEYECRALCGVFSHR